MDPIVQLRRENEDLIRSDRDYEMLMYSVNISLKHRFIFVETPKAGCSTMKLFLQRLEVGDPKWHRDGYYLHARQFSPLLTPLQVVSFRALRSDPLIRKFCVVRSPYTRLLSAYLDKIVHCKPQKGEILRLLGRDPIRLDPEVTFAEFVEAIALQSPEHMDFHWMPQTRLLMLPLFRYDLMIRLERMDEGIRKLSELLETNVAQFFSRVEQGRTDSDMLVQQYYSPSLASTVAEIYREDLELLGYQCPGSADA